jgi:hypothetical protein
MRHRRRRCAIRGALTGDFQPSSCLDASLHTRQHLGAREPRAAPGSTCFQQQRQQRQPRRRALCARASLSCRGTPPRPTYKSWFSYSFRVSKRTGAHCRLCPNGGPTWPRVSSSPRARPQPRVSRAMHRERPFLQVTGIVAMIVSESTGGRGILPRTREVSRKCNDFATR